MQGRAHERLFWLTRSWLHGGARTGGIVPVSWFIDTSKICRHNTLSCMLHHSVTTQAGKRMGWDKLKTAVAHDMSESVLCS